MYTRCPNCKTELNFKAPDNAAYLPDGYRHRIICPCCGIKIGVRIPKPHIIARAIEVPMAQPVIVEQPPVAEPQYAITPIVEEEPAEVVAIEELVDEQPTQMAAMAEEHSLYEPMVIEKKKSGLQRNIFMMILSLIIIGLNIASYVIADKINTGALKITRENLWLLSFEAFMGIDIWEGIVENPDLFVKAFLDMAGEYTFESVGIGILQKMPFIFFNFALINFVVSFISACGKKYGRAFNVVWSTLMGVAGCMTLFGPLVIINYGAELAGSPITMSVEMYINDLINANNFYLYYVAAGLGVLQWIFSLIFITPLKKVRRV